MGIFEKLEEIRQKPIATRRKILFISVTFSMIAVLIFWVGILKYQSRDKDKSADRAPSPLQIIKESFSIQKKQVEKNLPGEVYLRGN